jgi:hypothetical protein
MFKLDRFSAHTYQTTNDIKTNETGEVLVKTGDGYVNQHGDYIKKTGSNYFNVNTGINFNLGDDDE